VDALNYWMPQRWPNGGSTYTMLSVTFTGDVDSGGVDVEMDKDGDTATVQFTNDECYGTQLAPATALQRVYNASYE
jgi:hypothetical protein